MKDGLNVLIFTLGFALLFFGLIIGILVSVTLVVKSSDKFIAEQGTKRCKDAFGDDYNYIKGYLNETVICSNQKELKTI